MAQSAEEWSKVAFYEKVADDENAVPELRVLFARKANWLRILARLQAKGFQAHQNPVNRPTPIEREALLFSPTRLTAARTNNGALPSYDARPSVTPSQRLSSSVHGLSNGEDFSRKSSSSSLHLASVAGRI
jgi:hypothetical protein